MASPTTLARFLPYGVAALAVLLATAVRWLLDPYVGPRVPFIMYFAGVAFAAWHGGLRPALLAAVLAAAVALYFFVEPRHNLSLVTTDAWVSVVTFLAVCVVVAWLGGSMHAARHRAEAAAAEAERQREQWWTTLASIGDAVIVTDDRGYVVFLNAVAEALTGWPAGRAVGRPLAEVFRIVNEQTRKPADNPVERVLREGRAVGLANHTVLLAADGAEHPIDDSAAPVRNRQGEVIGVVLVFRDITEQRRAHRAAAQLAAIVASSEDAIIAKSLDGVIESWNAGAERLYGYKAEEVVGRPVAVLIPPDCPEEFPAVMERLRRNEPLGHYHTVRLRKDGTRVDVSARLSPVRDEHGAIVGASVVARDISAHKRAEQELKESESRFRSMADAAPVLLWVADPEGRCTFFNRPWLEFTGRSLAEEAGDGWLAGVHPEDLERRRAAYRAAFAGRRPFRTEYRLRRADGEYRWLLDAGVPRLTPEGEFAGFIGSCVDITDRRQAEDGVRFLSEASAVLASSLDYEATLAAVARLAVPRLADWCAVDMPQDDGTLRRLAVEHVDPARVELARELYRRFPPDPGAPGGVYQILRSGEPEWVETITDEMLVQSVADPELLRIMRELGLRSYMGVPLRVRDRTLGVLTFISAESGRRYGPVDLDLARDLARRAALAIENARLYAEARESDQRKDRFLATLAHELRNPLAPIRNCVQLLRLKPVADPQLAWARDVIDRQAGQLTRLVDDLLDVSRISRGLVELRPETVELQAVVRRAVETTRPLLDERGHALTVTLPDEPLRLRADPTRLEQVLANLLNNAAKYTEPGGEIELAAGCDGGEVAIRVRDSGIGIPPEFLPRLFEMFTQAERGRDSTRGGLGIGLSLVRSLVELHGGTIRAASPGPGQGSEFTVRLPLPTADVAVLAPAPRPELPAASTGGHRILVVDDNADAADSLADVLRAAGYETQVAHDGPAALRLALAAPPDLAFLDLGMPGMDGFEVARRLRAQPELLGLRLVALTGWGTEEDRRRTREAGFDHHLVKPADPDALRRLLPQWLSHNGQAAASPPRRNH